MLRSSVCTKDSGKNGGIIGSITGCQSERPVLDIQEIDADPVELAEVDAGQDFVSSPKFQEALKVDSDDVDDTDEEDDGRRDVPHPGHPPLNHEQCHHQNLEARLQFRHLWKIPGTPQYIKEKERKRQ